MATEIINFTETADSNGSITVTRSLSTGPVKVKVKNVRLRSSTTCQARNHHVVLTVSAGGQIDAWELELKDCTEAQILTDKKYGGNLNLKAVAGGFTPGEVVSGSGTIEYSIALFGLNIIEGAEFEPEDLKLRID